jgi:hypothetical protein
MFVQEDFSNASMRERSSWTASSSLLLVMAGSIIEVIISDSDTLFSLCYAVYGVMIVMTQRRVGNIMLCIAEVSRSGSMIAA